MEPKLLLFCVITLAGLIGHHDALPLSENGETVGLEFNYSVPTEEELNPEGLDEESKLLQELRPPEIDSEPNYYEKPIKQRKNFKKYNADEKWINKKPEVATQEEEEDEEEARTYSPLDYLFENIFYDLADHFFAPLARKAAEAAENDRKLRLNTGEVAPQEAQRRSDDDSNVRVDYQMHGYAGPQSYKFGYDTGKGRKDRQYRFEERDNDGKLKGEYGYMDKRGRMQIIKYTSSAEEGFKATRSQS